MDNKGIRSSSVYSKQNCLLIDLFSKIQINLFWAFINEIQQDIIYWILNS